MLFVGFGITELHTLAAHSTLAPLTQDVSSHSIPLPYSLALLIGIILAGADAAALKEDARAIASAFKGAAACKIGKEEFAHAVLRSRVMSKVTASAGSRSLVNA